MAFFPFFADISKAHCLVVGGGRVAARKVEKLVPFGVNITVVAPTVSDEISQYESVTVISREFSKEYLQSADFVISATDDEKISEEIFKLCAEKNIPVNTVDDPEKCTFFFPALVSREDVTIGISTSGKSPLFARFLREQAENLLTEKNLAALDILSQLRPIIKKKVSGEHNRKLLQEKILTLLLSAENPKDSQVTEEINRMIQEEAS
jgi:siroheme synthase-like protein